MTDFTNTIIAGSRALREFLERRAIEPAQVEIISEMQVREVIDPESSVDSGFRLFIIRAGANEIEAYGHVHGPLDALRERRL